MSGRGYRPAEPSRPGSRATSTGAEPPLELRADLRRALEPDLRRDATRPAGAGRCAGRRSASGSAPPTTWAASTGSSPRSQGTDVPVPPVGRPLRGRVGQRRALLRHGLRRGPDPAHQGRGGGELRRGGPRRRSASAWSTRWSRSTRSTPTRSASATWAARRTTSPASSAAGTASGRSRRRASSPVVDDVHDRLVRAHPRAGPGDDRPRRLPPRQHDPRRPTARSRRSSTGSSARSATRSPTSACCWSTGREPGDELMPLFEPPTTAAGFPPRDGRAGPLRGALRPRPRRDRLLRRARLLEAGDHPRGRLRPLRGGPVRQGRRGLPGVRQGRRAARRGRGRRPSDGCAEQRSGRRRSRAGRLGGSAPSAPASSCFAQRLSSRRAMTILWTSSGPSATFSMRLKRHIAGQRRVVGHPERAVDLDRAVEDVHDDVGGDDLDHRDLAPGLALALGVHLPGRHQGQQAGLLDLHPRLGDEVLDELLVGELAAERLARRWRAGTSSRSPARRCRSRACSGGCGPGRAGPGRSRSRPGAGRAGWRRARGSPRSGSRSGPGPPSWPITGTGRTRLKPGVVDRDEDHRGPRVRVGVGVGDDHRRSRPRRRPRPR